MRRSAILTAGVFGAGAVTIATPAAAFFTAGVTSPEAAGHTKANALGTPAVTATRAGDVATFTMSPGSGLAPQGYRVLRDTAVVCEVIAPGSVCTGDVQGIAAVTVVAYRGPWTSLAPTSCTFQASVGTCGSGAGTAARTETKVPTEKPTTEPVETPSTPTTATPEPTDSEVPVDSTAPVLGVPDARAGEIEGSWSVSGIAGTAAWDDEHVTIAGDNGAVVDAQESVEGDGSYGFEVVVLTGTTVLTVTQTDAAGNRSVRTVTIERTAPEDPTATGDSSTGKPSEH